MIRLLAIETSGEACSVALDDGDTVIERYEHAPMQHAELLLPMIRSVTAEAGVSFGDLDAIAFGRGPGSFTSLRIGIGVVQGLAWGSGLPVVPVSSLAAVALSAAERSEQGGLPVLVAMDARMQEVFCGLFQLGAGSRLEPVGEERVCPPDDVELPPTPFIVAGNGFDRFESLAEKASQAAGCFPDLWPRASTVVRLAREWLGENEPLPAVKAQPVYIRNQVASKPAQS
jgi:tRNA threonylcarbamoyladenosine biosynthesis protein TsaB